MEDLRQQLNEAQWRAVEYIDGPQMVIAGAGSGKTRVLTFKIAFLLRHGMYASNILALTFTNKAAREMKERIVQQVGNDQAAGLWMGTFHSVFARILRRESAAIGYNQNFTIYDQADSQALVKTIIKEMALDEKVYIPKTVSARISKAKENLMTPDAFATNKYECELNQRDRTPRIPEIYQRYQARLRQAGAMDFDDLLMHTYQLFRDNEAIRQRYANKFQYILVDEYQDTNYAQHIIVRQLASIHNRLCVVGDDAQSIYSFRGANIDNILTLGNHFPTLKIFKLEQNYRSTRNIVEAANSVIAKNTRQIPKHIYSNNQPGDPLMLLTAYSDIEEAQIVTRKITTLATNYRHSDIAILYRTNAQSRTFEESLSKAHIPYRIYGGLSFYQRKEIKDVLAYCRLAINPNDEEALRRVINYPTRGIGNTTISRLSVAAATHPCSIWTAITNHTIATDISNATRKKLDAFATLINSYCIMAHDVDAATLMQHIIRTSGIYDELRSNNDPDNETRRQNIDELINACNEFVSTNRETGGSTYMADYLQEVSLLSSVDENEDDSEGDNKITLMTIHASKGLEFQVVFIVGMDDEIFPGQHVCETPTALEEERRLFYVAITRAADKCYLTNAKMRRRYGQLNYETPSRFLRDIDPRYIRGIQVAAPKRNSFTTPYTVGRTATQHATLNTQHSHPHSSWRPLPKQTYNASTNSTPASRQTRSQFAAGQRVQHPTFGQGTVKAISGNGIDEKLTVNFDNVGQKILLTRFAKLTPL